MIYNSVCIQSNYVLSLYCGVVVLAFLASDLERLGSSGAGSLISSGGVLAAIAVVEIMTEQMNNRNSELFAEILHSCMIPAGMGVSFV